MPADARASPWLTALGPSLSSRLIALLSKDGSDMSVDTWCWQALYLLQAQLSPSQQDQILQHPTAQHASHCNPCLCCSFLIWLSAASAGNQAAEPSHLALFLPEAYCNHCGVSPSCYSSKTTNTWHVIVFLAPALQFSP